jgi:uncharacterized membrane protein
MEKIIESAIDNGLESISSGLYFFSIGLGLVLVILGIILFLANISAKGKKGVANGGLICMAIGAIAIVSGFVQM